MKKIIAVLVFSVVVVSGTLLAAEVTRRRLPADLSNYISKFSDGGRLRDPNNVRIAVDYYINVGGDSP